MFLVEGVLRTWKLLRKGIQMGLKGNSVLYLLDGCPQHRQNVIIERAQKIMYTQFINKYDEM